MKKSIIALLAVLLLFGAGVWIMQHTKLAGLRPVITPPPIDIGQWKEGALYPGKNKTDFPLNVPDGFVMTVLADDLSNARVLALGPEGNLWVSRTKDGVVTKIVMEEGKAASQEEVFTDLNNPHGLVFDLADPDILYIAEEQRVAKTNWREAGPLETVVDLPEGERHFTRTLFYGPDNELYVSIGSNCDVCQEEDARLASIQRVNLEEGTLEAFATGLRNTIFTAIHPVTGALWGTDMGRDGLGDDLPPDEVNILTEGGWYGWPWFYGKNTFDEDFADGVMPGFAQEAQPSHIDLGAHVAPMGIAFIPEEGWPEAYWHHVLIAQHGSWNREDPVGYNVVRIALDEEGNPAELDEEGNPVIAPFIDGWLTEEDEAIGRPVDLLIQPGGLMYISDDKAGVVYKVSRLSEEEQSDAALSDIIVVQSPDVGAEVTSPLRFSGEARGQWYFEGDFPVELVDSEGKTLGQGIASAQEDWMSEDFVPFTGEIVFDVPEGTTEGALIFRKDNPSGLPEHDAQLQVPVRLGN